MHHFSSLPKRGLEVTFVDTSDTRAVAETIREETRLVYVETPANPTLQVTDIAAVAEIATDTGALLAVDSTIATPVAPRPLELGACQGRGTNRRMAEVSAHLCDRVIPQMPVRQWVLSVPKRLRPHLAGDAELAGAVLRILLRVIEGALRESAREAPPDEARLGAVSFAGPRGGQSVDGAESWGRATTAAFPSPRREYIGTRCILEYRLR